MDKQEIEDVLNNKKTPGGVFLLGTRWVVQKTELDKWVSPLLYWQRICSSPVRISWTHVCHFIMETRNRTGDLYPARTLANTCAGTCICRFVIYEIGRPDCNICLPIIYLLKQERLLIRRCVSPQTKVLEP